MNDSVVISICCITYNQKDYIEDALISFLNQNCPYNYEIIIGDDGSNDGTREILKKYELMYPEKINVIYNDANLGPNGNILSVIGAAKGGFIAFCEGDDYWIDNCKIAKQYDVLNRYPNYEFCFHPAYMENSNKRIEHFSYGNNVKKLYIDDVLKVVGQFAPTSSYMFRRTVINKIPKWFIDCSIGDLFMELYSMENGAIYIPEVMSVYRVNAAGSWSETIKNDLEAFTNKHLNIAHHLKLARNDFERHKALFNIKIANVYLNMCTRFIMEKKNELFLIYLMKANEENYSYTNKQKLYNALKKLPECIYFIHYMKSLLMVKR